RRRAAPPRAGSARRSASVGGVAVVAVKPVGVDQGRPFRTAEPDRPAAAQRLGAAGQDEGLVGTRIVAQLVRLDQRALNLGSVLRPPGASGGHDTARLTAFGVAGAGRDDRVLAAHLRHFAGGFPVLDGGEELPGGAVEPGLFAGAAPLADELAERLIEQKQGDAVFAAGIARLFEEMHVADRKSVV